MAKMNLWLRFPKGTVGRGAVPPMELQARITAVSLKGVMLVQRGDDVFEAAHIIPETWRMTVTVCRQMFPEATRYQKV